MEEASTGRWPAGHRAAVVLTFDVDGEYGVMTDHGPDDWYWRSQAAYDLEAGVWRILELLADFDVGATFCWVGRAAEDRPDAVRAAHEGGHEIACHGWDHREYTGLDDDAQRQDILRTREVIEGITGERPAGHKTPGWRFNERTVPILQELGFRWNMDLASADLPFLMRPVPGAEPVVQLPPSRTLDDYTFFIDSMMPPRHAYETWRDEVDVLRQEGKLACFTFHPWITGRPANSRALSMLLDYVVSLGDVWLARADHVAFWWLEREREASSRSG